MGSEELKRSTPPIDPSEYSRALASQEAALNDAFRRDQEAKWHDGLKDLQMESFNYNTGVLLSHGVMSGLSLVDACAIALATATSDSYVATSIRRTLSALRDQGTQDQQ